MAECITLTRRVKYAGDVHTELLKAGWDLETATLFVNNIPDADAVAVKNGRWIDPIYHSFLKLMEATCSSCKVRGSVRFKPNECGFVVPDSDFCPNCGAKMKDGE